MGLPPRARVGEAFEQAYPADFICEAIDQTRGWFYTLMAVGTLVFDRVVVPQRRLLGHILAEDGRKMSKHLGNILEPIPLMDQHGADAVRWFMAASGSPWASRRVGHASLQETVRKVLLTYWNTVAFQVLYAAHVDVVAGRPGPELADRPVLDRWALSEAHRLATEVTAALEAFDTQRAGSLLAAYVDDLSNWYVRRSRRRFWAGDPAALATLHECLYVVTLLMAPITPFITERVWQDVFRATSTELPESVHLASWPRVDGSLVDDDLRGQMSLARRLVELGRAARADAKVRTRQPLSRALVGSAAWSRLDEELRREVADELNVGLLEPLSAAGADLVDFSAKGNFRALGKRFGKQTPVVAAAIAAADAAGSPTRWARRPRRGAGRRRGRRGAPRRGDRLRATPGGLVGGQRAGRDRGARPRADPGAGPRGPGPRGGAAGAGGPQEQPASTSATGSCCAGRPTATSPRRCASTPPWWPTRCWRRR